MEPLPAPKFQQRPWRFARKRRRSTNEAGDNEGKINFCSKETERLDKIVKKNYFS